MLISGRGGFGVDIPSFFALYINCDDGSAIDPLTTSHIRPGRREERDEGGGRGGAGGTHEKPHAGTESSCCDPIDGSDMGDGRLPGIHRAAVLDGRVFSCKDIKSMPLARAPQKAP